MGRARSYAPRIGLFFSCFAASPRNKRRKKFLGRLRLPKPLLQKTLHMPWVSPGLIQHGEGKTWGRFAAPKPSRVGHVQRALQQG